MISEEYKRAYTEVLEILKYVPKEEYEKISKDKLDFYEKNKKQGYNFNYDVNKTLDEQGVSKISKAILAIIYRDYWASDEVRNEIIQMQGKIRKNIKEKTQIDFDPEIAFKKNIKVEENNSVNNEMVKVENKSAFSRFIDKIKSIFHIN